jgi:hypothetical protein
VNGTISTAYSKPLSLDRNKAKTCLVCVYISWHTRGSRLEQVLLYSDETAAIINGNGVLTDSAGLNRTEFISQSICLAKLRGVCELFDKSKLRKDGYLLCGGA